MEFYYRRISAVIQCKPLRGQPIKKLFFFFEFSRVPPGAHPLTRKTDEIGIGTCKLALTLLPFCYFTSQAIPDSKLRQWELRNTERFESVRAEINGRLYGFHFRVFSQLAFLVLTIHSESLPN